MGDRMRKKYTVDEIIDDKYAVLLDREDESKKLDILLSDLPIKVKDGDIVELEFKNDRVIFAKVDREETEREREKVRKLIERLKSRGSKDLKL